MHIAVVGAGLAGAKAVEELRTQGYDGDVTLFGAEPHPPYERPPLSKGVLLGKVEPESAFVHETSWYADHNIDLLVGAEVTSLDLGGRGLVASGRSVSYDRLLLATGARARHLAMADDSGAEVIYLRTMDDARLLRSRLGGPIVIIGGGWIGLEVASAARTRGAEVTVIEPEALPLVHALGPEIAPMFVDLHREHGVDLRLNTSVTGISHEGDRTTVHLSDGTECTPELIVVGIGAIPNDDLATRAGLSTDRGIFVDAKLQTSDPNVFAAGDVAQHDHPVIGRRLRVEHWDTAIHQGRHAARAMLGDGAPYLRQPYFFTDQYDLGMEYIGSVGPGGYDDLIIRGSLADDRVMNALWIHGGTVIAGMHANDWDATDHLKVLVGQAANDALRNADIPLGEVAELIA